MGITEIFTSCWRTKPQAILWLAVFTFFLSLPAQATLVNINSDNNSSSPTNLTVFNNKLYFQADDGTHSNELWGSDGTVSGTTLIKDINSGGGSYPTNLAVFNNKLYFAASDSTNGQELWVSDGTESGTTLVKDISSGSEGSAPANLTVFNNKLYFQARDNTNGNELWVSDGTANGTTLVKDISSGTNNSFPSSLTVLNNKLYFQANNAANGDELWVSDGTASGTTLVKDINSGTGGSSPYNFTVFNNKLYFRADDGTNGNELWVSDGTASGTTLVKDINSGFSGSYPGSPTVFNNKLYFQARDSTNGNELWVSDGTASGTMLFKDIKSGSGNSNPGYLTAINNKLYFVADDSTNGSELWSSDGTVSGTALVKDINSGTNGSYPTYLTTLNNKLYFRASDSMNGGELWVSDGTASGTTLVKDINSGTDGSYPAYFTALNNKLYFQANDGMSGDELWILDFLSVISKTPDSGATSVSVNTTSLSLTFNTAVTAGTGNITVHKIAFIGMEHTLTGIAVDSIDVATSGVTINGQTATISLRAGLFEPNTSYYVTVPSGVFTGTDGSSLTGWTDFSAWEFRTGMTLQNQLLSFDSATPSSKTLGDAAFSVTATSSSRLAVTLVSSTPTVCSVSGNSVSLLTVGTCTLTANQSGNADYNAAAQVTTDITVNATTQGNVGNSNTSIAISRGHMLDLREESISTYATGKPSGMEFNLGSYSYRVVGLSTTTPETINVTLTFASAIPTGAKLYKVSGTGYTEITGVSISGNTATFAITDGGSLDADGVHNGTIVDPVALGAPPSSGGSGGTASSGGGGSFGWAELLFAVSIFGAALRRRLTVFGN